MDDMLRVETRLEKVEAEAGNIALHVRQTSASSEANDEQGTHTTATDTRWLTLRSPLGTAPVTCARLETKTSCSLGGKDVAWGRAVDLDARYRTT